MKQFLAPVVVLCYNEPENIYTLLSRLENALRRYTYEAVLVNYGSTDSIILKLELASQADGRVLYLHFSRNVWYRQFQILQVARISWLAIAKLLEGPKQLVPGHFF